MAYRSGESRSISSYRNSVDTSRQPPTSSSLGQAGLRAEINPRTAGRPFTPLPELDCVRRLLPSTVVFAVERRARDIGMGADRVLITAGLMPEEDYITTLAQHLGVPFDALDELPREACPLDDLRLINAAAAGLLPVQDADNLALIVAPRGLAARRLFDLVRWSSEIPKHLRLTSTDRLRRFVVRHCNGAIGRKATHELQARHPDLSAATLGLRLPPAGRAVSLGLVATMVAAPQMFNTVVGTALSLVFLAWAGLRLFGAFNPVELPRKMARLPEHRLPIYTIIVALYREAAAVKGLVAALDALDYPPEKLDILLVLEPDDIGTRNVLESMKLGAPYTIVVAPDVGPRTKPKALNATLPFARGTFTAIYDAEDRPEPDQLRRAVGCFLANGRDLACVQARLTIDNTSDSCLTRLFTAEYAGLFDVFLPGLAAHRLPLPLGGSSNHFRTAVLRDVGGWDAYNVTEDADIGMRLARFGYFTAMINSTTYEEAPTTIGPWLKQRTRWIKGWMQTWLVHMRSPRRLLCELGIVGFLTLQLVVGGTVLSALVHPVFLVLFSALLTSDDSFPSDVLAGFYGGTLLSGYVASAGIGLLGLARRRLLSCGWVVVLVPFYWMLLSLAAWRALYMLVRRPYHWEKTDHGLARTSRLAWRR